MIEIWPQAIELVDKIHDKLNQFDTQDLPEKYRNTSKDFTWDNRLWTSHRFRRAHVQLIDAREHKKMMVLHMCIFPHYNNPDPIFGFDIVAGQHKITGAFHDFSKVGDCDLYDWYQDKMSQVTWNKKRELPEWAQKIFSPNMLAAGNIQTQEEFEQLSEIVLDNLTHYLYNLGMRNVIRDYTDYTEAHNNYCKNQKLNPHTPNMMETLGVDRKLFMEFMDDVQFMETR
jgi:hypothetical protein